MNKKLILTELSKKTKKNGNNNLLSVLDLGCGTGIYWKSVTQYFNIKKITGVDIQSDYDISFENSGNCFSHTMMEINRASNINLFEFECIQSEIVQFVSNRIEKFDLIVCFQILSLLEIRSSKILLSDLREILNNLGFIAICLPNKDFVLKTIGNWPTVISHCNRNKFNLSLNEFKNFVKEFNIEYHIERDEYHWAILSCR
ncbi:MAG: class I SAM-dependent methyltransferase [Chitinophagales bacterium]|jgi:SAM-dependent methyltransferase|nr:class I SAM-dependent methyltransferase [Chitinophagales bacterium]